MSEVSAKIYTQPDIGYKNRTCLEEMSTTIVTPAKQKKDSRNPDSGKVVGNSPVTKRIKQKEERRRSERVAAKEQGKEKGGSKSNIVDCTTKRDKEAARVTMKECPGGAKQSDGHKKILHRTGTEERR